MSFKPKRKRVMKKAMLQPVHLLYQFYVNKNKIHVWLYDNKDVRIEGFVKGFDEYMNIVLKDAEELSIKKKTKKKLGEIMLKGENISLVQDCEVEEEVKEAETT